MKKILLLFTTLAMMTACSLCFAADGNDLNKQQKTAEHFINAIDSAPSPEYTVIAPLLNAKLAEKFTDKQYAVWQKSIKEQFGTLKEAKFRLFERLNDGSIVTYLCKFDKQEHVFMQFVFDQKNALFGLNFRIVNEQKPAENEAKK